MPEPPNEHPAFPQPTDPAVAIWRYLDYSKFEWLVMNRRLFMPCATYFDDPLEGTIPIGEQQWWNKLLRKAVSPTERSIGEYNRDMISRFAHAFKANYYVSCWHTSITEAHDMWALYTDHSGSAVAISTTYAALRAQLPNYVYLGLVRYIDYAHERVLAANMYDYIMQKHISFSFEREVRAVVLAPAAIERDRVHFGASLFESETRAGLRVFAPSVDPGLLIRSVVLHPDAQHDFQSQVSLLCVSNELPIPATSAFAKA